MNCVTKNDLEYFFKITLKSKIYKFYFGTAATYVKNTIVFFDDLKFLDDINQNPCIDIVITSEDLSSLIIAKETILSQDIRHSYFTLYNKTAENNYCKTENKISKTANINESAFIESYNVEIGENTIIGPNCSILADTIIGDNCVIQSNTTIGSIGFEYKKTKQGLMGVFHDGKVIIKDNVEIGANTCVDKGFSFKDTIIGKGTKVDNLVHIAHGVNLGENNLIVASSVIAGSVNTGNNVWVGPNATISHHLNIGDNAFITMGSVVTRDVGANEKVTGNFAIPHAQFLTNLKKSVK